MKRTVVAVVVAGVIGAGITGGVVAAQTTTNDPEVIYACVKKLSGIPRIVSGPGECRRFETEINWNQQGPPGGGGVSGYENVEFNCTASEEDLPATVTQPNAGCTIFPGGPPAEGEDAQVVAEAHVDCPFGKLAVSGGFSGDVPGQTLVKHVHVFNPTPGGVGWNFVVTLAQSSDDYPPHFDWVGRFNVTCVDVAAS